MKFVSSFSLFLLVACGLAQFTGLSEQIDSLGPEEGLKIVKADKQIALDEVIGARIAEIEKAKDKTKLWKRFKEDIHVWAITEASSAELDDSPTKLADEITKDPKYKEAPGAENESWLVTALKRLERLLRFQPPERSGPEAPSWIGGWIFVVVWVLIAGIIIALGVFAFRYIRWTRQLKRKSRAVLEDEEPERTLDEWLGRADELAAAGKYREAVRALYVSCLLKMDEARIARFDRSETNWEHLSRIHASSRRPEGLDFLPTTKAFDRIWYGHQTKGAQDFEEFRNWYAQVESLVRGMA